MNKFVVHAWVFIGGKMMTGNKRNDKIQLMLLEQQKLITDKELCRGDVIINFETNMGNRVSYCSYLIGN